MGLESCSCVARLINHLRCMAWIESSSCMSLPTAKREHVWPECIGLLKVQKIVQHPVSNTTVLAASTILVALTAATSKICFNHM